MRCLSLEKRLTDHDAARLEGKLLEDNSYDLLLQDESVTVVKPDGTLLLDGQFPVGTSRTGPSPRTGPAIRRTSPRSRRG
jgi:hypothetical protein